jgi:hypothetical protein
MLATIKLSPSEGFQLTLKQLFRMYDTHLLETWDHTAGVLARLYNIQVTIANLMGGKQEYLGFFDMHPYREMPTGSGKQKFVVTPSNMSVLRAIARTMVAK